MLKWTGNRGRTHGTRVKYIRGMHLQVHPPLQFRGRSSTNSMRTECTILHRKYSNLYCLFGTVRDIQFDVTIHLWRFIPLFGEWHDGVHGPSHIQTPALHSTWCSKARLTPWAPTIYFQIFRVRWYYCWMQAVAIWMKCGTDSNPQANFWFHCIQVPGPPPLLITSFKSWNIIIKKRWRKQDAHILD